VQSHYRYRSVDELEEAWLKHLRDTRRQPMILANNTNPGRGTAPHQVMVRQTAPPVQPLLDGPTPIYRGQMGEESPRNPLTGRPGYLPDYNASQNSQWPTQDHWQPAPPPTVRLGPPQLEPR